MRPKRSVSLEELGRLVKPALSTRPAARSPRPATPSQPAPQADDGALFRQAMAGAVPLKTPPRHVPPPPEAPPIPIHSRLDDYQVMIELGEDPSSHEDYSDTGEDESFLRRGMGPEVLRKLRRLEWNIQAEVHLRLLTQPEARAELDRFLQMCADRGLRCVRVIHGKGNQSPNRIPVLKRKVKVWLARRDEVLAYCQAPEEQGGGGALLVLLRG